MEASKADAEKSESAPARDQASGSSTPTSSSVQEATPPPPTRPGSTFLFDRAQMERERLARQKRLRPDIVQNTDGGGGEDEEESVEDTRSAKRQRVSSSTVPTRTNVVSSSTKPSMRTTAATGMSTAPSGPDTGEGIYLEGELRQTANKHVEAAKDKRPLFRLTDVLAPVGTTDHDNYSSVDQIFQRNEISFAIVSAYVINLPWFYGFFNRDTPVIVATHDPSGTMQNSFTLCVPTYNFMKAMRQLKKYFLTGLRLPHSYAAGVDANI